MASAFAHIVIPAVAYVALKGDKASIRLFFLAALLSIIPDIDVIAFKFGIAYESQWGHRGFTHSLVFAVFVAAFFSLFKNTLRSHPLAIFLICFVAYASHPLLDAMTNGGLGVALFWPFEHDRVFFSFRPIAVSPIGIAEFFTDRGARVLYSELFWVFIPGVVVALVSIAIRRTFFKNV